MEQMWPKECGESTAALSRAVGLLEQWGRADEPDGAGALDMRREACLEKIKEAAQRRLDEGREPPPLKLRTQLDEAWQEMATAAQEIDVKIGAMLAWQRQHTDAAHARLLAVRQALGPQRLPMATTAGKALARSNATAPAREKQKSGEHAERAADRTPKAVGSEAAAAGLQLGEAKSAVTGEVSVELTEQKGGCAIL